MTTTEILALVFRWLHILAAITAVGGTIFTRFALLPGMSELGESERARLQDAIRRRWSRWVAAAILFLLVSGFYNFFAIIRTYELPKPYHMLFGIKFLLALGVFFLASALSGRSALAVKLRQNAKLWLTLNLIMAVAIVCISGVLRNLRENAPKKKAEQVVTAQSIDIRAGVTR